MRSVLDNADVEPENGLSYLCYWVVGLITVRVIGRFGVLFLSQF
jgi:hypothetical protein